MIFKIVDAIKLFLWKLGKAITFAVLDYDAQLQTTKSPNERIMIWIIITVVSIIGILLLFLILNIFLLMFLKIRGTPLVIYFLIFVF